MKNHDEKRQLILTATWELMEEFGYKGTTMDRVCRKTGMARGNFYHYFATKEEIFYAIIDTACENLDCLARGILADPSIGVNDAVRAYIRAVVDFRTNYRLNHKLKLEADMEGNPVVLQGMKRLDDSITAGIASMIDTFAQRGLIPPQNSRLGAFILFETYNALVFRWEIQHGELSPEEVEDIMVSLLSKGILSLESTRNTAQTQVTV